ncbi:MAG: DUF4198 domain-containing protein [Oceanospirillaceae bacterium]|nr:DUF4198 domain-containing protein [Oceanospirillaceae bacterium]
MKNLKLVALSALMASSIVTQVQAHAIWIAERHDNLAIIYGDLSDQGYETKYVENLVAKKSNLSSGEININIQEDHILFTVGEDVTYASAEYVRGYSTKDKEGKRFSLPKNEVENAVSSGYYVKYASHIAATLTGKPKQQGIKLEILPLENPTKLLPGSELPIQVLFDGQPLAGVKVYGDYVTDHINTYTTDSEGKVTITVRNNGLNVIAAKYSLELKDDPTKDKFGYYSTVSFKSAAKEH